MAVLAVSRQFSCGAEEIAKEVAIALEYDYVDRARLADDLSEYGKNWKVYLAQWDETCPTIWDKYDKGYKGLLSLVEAKILEYAWKDRVVIVGRGAHIILRGLAQVLAVRFLAPEERRLERLMVEHDIDEETAKWLLKKMDTERECYIRANYGESADKGNFDLIFDTSMLPKGQIVERIIEELRTKDRKTSEEDKARLMRVARAGMVKARIMMDPRVFIPTSEVKEEANKLLVSGVVHSEKELRIAKELAMEAAHGVPLVFNLRFRIGGRIF